MRDEPFRRELMANPKEVIRREYGVEMGPDVEIRVLEESPGTSYLVLPSAPVTPGQELSDKDLASASGGWDTVSCNNQTCYSCVGAC